MQAFPGGRSPRSPDCWSRAGPAAGGLCWHPSRTPPLPVACVLRSLQGPRGFSYQGNGCKAIHGKEKVRVAGM